MEGACLAWSNELFQVVISQSVRVKLPDFEFVPLYTSKIEQSTTQGKAERRRAKQSKEEPSILNLAPQHRRLDKQNRVWGVDPSVIIQAL